MTLTFVTGGARSGKTRLALQLAEQSGFAVTYVATARRSADDEDWNERIRRHVAERPPHWRTRETANDAENNVAAVLDEYGAQDILLVDSLGSWLADRLFRNDASGPAAGAVALECSELAHGLRAARCSTIVVSEEVGSGVVPEYPSARLFRDLLGALNQQIAAAADAAYLAVCGYAIDLKRGVVIL